MISSSDRSRIERYRTISTASSVVDGIACDGSAVGVCLFIGVVVFVKILTNGRLIGAVWIIFVLSDLRCGRSSLDPIRGSGN